MKLEQISPAVILFGIGIILVILGAMLKFVGKNQIAQPILLIGLASETIADVFTIYAVIKRNRANSQK